MLADVKKSLQMHIPSGKHNGHTGSYMAKVVAVKELICAELSDDDMQRKCEELRLEGMITANTPTSMKYLFLCFIVKKKILNSRTE